MAARSAPQISATVGQARLPRSDQPRAEFRLAPVASFQNTRVGRECSLERDENDVSYGYAHFPEM